MGRSMRSPIGATALRWTALFVLCAHEASADFDFGDVTKALSNVKHTDVQSAVNEYSHQGSKLLETTQDAVQSATEAVADVRHAIREGHEGEDAALATTTPAPVPEVEAEGMDTSGLKQALRGTHVQSTWNELHKAINGDPNDITDRFKHASLKEALNGLTPAGVADELAADAKKVHDELKDSQATVSGVVAEMSSEAQKAGISRQNYSSVLSEHLDKIRNTIGTLKDTNFKELTSKVPNTTAGEAIAAAQETTGEEMLEKVGLKKPKLEEQQTIVNDKDKEKEDEGSASGMVFPMLVLMIFAGICGSAYHFFTKLIRPKRTRMPILDGDLNGDDSVHMMWMGGSGAARDLGGPPQPGFTRF